MQSLFIFMTAEINVLAFLLSTSDRTNQMTLSKNNEITGSYGGKLHD